MSKFVSDLKGDCPRRDVHSLHERCDVLCPDLPKVLWMARKPIEISKFAAVAAVPAPRP
jgi:hypothetical protein